MVANIRVNRAVANVLSRQLNASLVRKNFSVQLWRLVGVRLVMNIYVSGILLLIVVFRSMCSNSSSNGVKQLTRLQAGTTLTNRYGSVTTRTSRSNMCPWFNRLVKRVTRTLFSGCVRQLAMKTLKSRSKCSYLGTLGGKNSRSRASVKNMKTTKLQTLSVLLRVVSLRAPQLVPENRRVCELARVATGKSRIAHRG